MEIQSRIHGIIAVDFLWCSGNAVFLERIWDQIKCMAARNNDGGKLGNTQTKKKKMGWGEVNHS